MLKQQLLKYSRNLVVAVTLAGTIFSAVSNSFARTRPPLSLKPEAVVSYVDFNAGVASPLNPSTDRVFIKMLNISRKAVLATQQIYAGTTVEKSMVMEQRNKTLHFALIDLGATFAPNFITYITVSQAGTMSRETVPQPGSLANRMIRKVKITLWENGNTAIPVILADSLDSTGGMNQIDVLAKINGVWQSAMVQNNLTGVEAMAIKVDSITNTAYIAFDTGAPGSSIERFIAWNNVSNSASWAFSVTANITNLNPTSPGGPRTLKIARNALLNSILTVNIGGLQLSGYFGIVLHDTQNQNQQIAAQAALMHDLFEFSPGILGFLVKNYQSGPSYLADDFSLYLDGSGIISSFHIETPHVGAGRYFYYPVFQQENPVIPSSFYMAAPGVEYTAAYFPVRRFLKIYTANFAILLDTWEIDFPVVYPYLEEFRNIDLAVY